MVHQRVTEPDLAQLLRDIEFQSGRPADELIIFFSFVEVPSELIPQEY